MKSIESLKIWTDGACFPNPGKGAWAWVSEDGRDSSGIEEKSTNQRMELMAVIRAIEENLDRPLLIISDSQYVIKGAIDWHHGWLRNGWMNKQGKPVVNRELWERLIAAMKLTIVKFQWVKGHSGDPMNEKADRLANSLVGITAGAFQRFGSRKIEQGKVYEV